MKKTFTERNLAAMLYVMVLITFSFAQQDSKKLEKLYLGFRAAEATPLTSIQKIATKPLADKTETKQKGSQVN